MSAERKNSTIIDGKPVSRRELLKAGLMTAAAVSPLAALAQQVQGGANSNPNHRIIEAERPIAGKAVGLEKGGAEVKAMNAILLSDVNIPGKGKMNFVQALTSEVYNPILKAAQEKFFAEIKANPTSKAAVEYDKNYAASVRAANEMGVEPPKKYSIVQLPTYFDRDNDVVENRDTLGLGEDPILWTGDHQGVLYPKGGIYFARNDETYPSWNNVVSGPAQFDGRPRVRQLNYVIDGVNNEAIRIDIELLAIPGVTVPTLQKIKEKMETGTLGSVEDMIKMMKPIQGRSHMFAWVEFEYNAAGQPIGWKKDLNSKENVTGRQQFIAADNIAKFLNGKDAFNFTAFINHNGRDVTPPPGGGLAAALAKKAAAFLGL